MLPSTRRRGVTSERPSGTERSTGNEPDSVPRGTPAALPLSPQAPQATAELIRPSLEAVTRSPAPQELLVRLAGLVDLLVDWAARINLTGHRTHREVVHGLLGRALGLSTLLPPEGTVVDLGSGAGFPGLPLAILSPGRRVTLVESRARRHHFQRHAIRSLGIANARALLGRAEELEPHPHDLVIAQAVGPPGEVVDLALPWVRVGGRVVIPGLSATPLRRSGFSTTSVESYPMPGASERIPVWIGVRAQR